MKIVVAAKPNAKDVSVQKIDETHYMVAVKEPPVQGRANAAIVNALAEYFGVSPSGVRILLGHTSRRKVVDVAIETQPS